MAEPMLLDRSLRLDGDEVAKLAADFEERAPKDLLRWAIYEYGDRLALATSFQADGMAILDMAWRIDPGIRVITIDSGRLPQETYDLIEQVRLRYGIAVEIFSPEAADLETFVGENGPNPFYRSLELRVRCCEIRKVVPLSRALTGFDAWISGQRRDQTTTRRSIRTVEIDHAHGGLIKLNPLARWNEDQVWEYLRANDVPYHALYDRGFKSIGCTPCTRATRPGEDPRAGRWWWETNLPKECGIHCTIDWNSLRA